MTASTTTLADTMSDDLKNVCSAAKKSDRFFDQKTPVPLFRGLRQVKGHHRGMSVFDKADLRLPFTWYRIPANTKIPKSLAVTRDEDWTPPAKTSEEEAQRDPVHYTVAPKDDMPLSLFLQHLREMAVDIEKV